MIKTFHRRNVGIKLLSKEKNKKNIPKIGSRLTAFVGVNLHTRFPVPMIWIYTSQLENKLFAEEQTNSF